jgi:H+/Cl- antiporter ClcA
VIAAGIAGGFGSVFGTPIAGLIFGLEVVSIGRIEYDALIPALVAAVVGDQVTRALGIVHTAYPAVPSIPFSVGLAGKLALVGGAMALVTVTFIELTHFIKSRMERRVPRLPFRMFVGGVAIVAMWRLVGSSDYLGLGIPTILRAFGDPHLPVYSFAAKIAFTAVTLGCGFLGGEVTPLFFIGATLGNVLARLLGVPIDLGAAVGLAAVFGAAANTPLALSIMMVELVGGAVLPYVVVVTVIAYLLSGHRGIYPAQRLLRKKHGPALDKPVSLRDYQDRPDANIGPPK